MQTTYADFLNKKSIQKNVSGFKINENIINKNLFEFQKHIAEKALYQGKFAGFADCGLGKTIMEFEIANQVVHHTNKKSLILAPLAVCIQHKQEAVKFGYDLDKIDLVNYENLHNIDVNEYSAVLLDESSILKNFEGKTKKMLNDMFRNMAYKYCFTATPSPNDPMELGNHSEFLDNKTRLEILATYFVHDGGDTSKWRLKKHAVDDFYKFVSTWSIMLSKPQDIGFDMSGYDLPPINYVEHQISTKKVNNGQLFNDMAVNATNFNVELKRTQDERIEKAVELATNDLPHIVWVRQNEESSIVTKNIPGAMEVKGSDKPEAKAEKLLGFARGDFRVLVTKPKIAQYGLNYQHCGDQTQMSLDFSFESLYQCIRRSQRFGRLDPVNNNIITTDTMQNVVQSIKQKEAEDKIMRALMIKNQTSYV